MIFSKGVFYGPQLCHGTQFEHLLDTIADKDKKIMGMRLEPLSCLVSQTRLVTVQKVEICFLINLKRINQIYDKNMALLLLP